MKVVITQAGNKFYRDENGRQHREDGPATIYRDGGYEYWRNGTIVDSYEAGTPDFYVDGEYRWFHNRNVHSIHRPAIDFPTGYKIWYKMDEPIWPKL